MTILRILSYFYDYLLIANLKYRIVDDRNITKILTKSEIISLSVIE